MKYRKILSFSALLLPILLTSCNPANPTSTVSTPKATDTGKPSTATPKPDVPKSDTGAGGGSGTTITSTTLVKKMIPISSNQRIHPGLRKLLLAWLSI